MSLNEINKDAPNDSSHEDAGAKEAGIVRSISLQERDREIGLWHRGRLNVQNEVYQGPIKRYYDPNAPEVQGGGDNCVAVLTYAQHKTLILRTYHLGSKSTTAHLGIKDIIPETKAQGAGEYQVVLRCSANYDGVTKELRDTDGEPGSVSLEEVFGIDEFDHVPTVVPSASVDDVRRIEDFANSATEYAILATKDGALNIRSFFKLEPASETVPSSSIDETI